MAGGYDSVLEEISRSGKKAICFFSVIQCLYRYTD